MIYASVAKTKKLNIVEEMINRIKRRKGGKVTEAELAELMQHASEDTVNALVQEMQNWKKGVETSQPEVTPPATPSTPDKGGKGTK